MTSRQQIQRLRASILTDTSSLLLLLPSKPRPSVNILTAFATQVALVCTGIRSAYLVDTLVLRLDRLPRFLEHLQRQSPFPLAICCADEQAFFVNTTLLASRICQNDLPRWISVTSPQPCQIPEPVSFKLLLNQLGHLPAGAICPLRAERPTDLIPLAAFLLEYPVAYVVETDTDPFLAHVLLDVYECTFDLEEERLPLVKFSVPAGCDIQDLTPSLQDRFQARIGLPIRVVRETVMFDRLAL